MWEGKVGKGEREAAETHAEHTRGAEAEKEEGIGGGRNDTRPIALGGVSEGTTRGGIKGMRGEKNGLARALKRPLPTWQEVTMVHQEVETVEAAEDEVTLQIWPSKGAIQIEDGTLMEQQVYRQEANTSMFVLVACRLQMAVTEVSYKSISYRRRPGGKEETQYYYEVSVPPSAAAEILSKEGVAVKGGMPGWIETETGSIQGSGEDWLTVKGTMGHAGYDKATEKEAVSDRTVHALVIAS